MTKFIKIRLFDFDSITDKIEFAALNVDAISSVQFKKHHLMGVFADVTMKNGKDFYVTVKDVEPLALALGLPSAPSIEDFTP